MRAQVQSLGAMLGPAWFRLGEREVQPFAVAPWASDSGEQYDRLPGILRRLRGEWPCVPYGIERFPGELPHQWAPEDENELQWTPEPHGRSSNAEWTLWELASDRIELTIEYPEPHPVRTLTRRICASAERPELEMSLRIEVRASCSLPIGLHPTLRLPSAPRSALLQFAAGVQAWTSPVPLEPHVTRFRPGVRGASLTQIPSIDGTEDITKLPLPYPAEEIVLVTGHSGRATLIDQQSAYAVTIAWDAEVFPACQLWLSNRGREYYPWNGRFLALGVEPVRAAFDLGTRASQRRSNPLSLAGTPCTQDMSPTQPFDTTYRIAVASEE